MVLIEVVFEIVTEVAGRGVGERRHSIGHSGLELQLVPVVHSPPRTGPGAVDRMRGAWAQHRQRADARTPKQCRAPRPSACARCSNPDGDMGQ